MRLVQASTAAELSTGRGAFQKHFFFILRRPRVTLSPRQSIRRSINLRGAALHQPQASSVYLRRVPLTFLALMHVALLQENILRAGLMQEKHSMIDMYHCINKTWYLRKNKGKQAEIIIFYLYFLNFIHYIVVAIYAEYRIVDSSNIYTRV